MRYTLLILLFVVSKLFAQVGAPNLRCLELLPNGDVKLTWLPPADPGNTFTTYEIYTSISAGGPFSLITGSLGPVGTNTFVHTVITGTAQSRYYYIRSVFNGGADFSPHSDTLRSIILNIVPAQVGLKLEYNSPHTPLLNGSSKNFTITKEYPVGSINNLAIIPGLSFTDTIDVCSAPISYQVKIADNTGGCISRSNVISGVYDDVKAPDSTRVDSISVLPNGNTVLAWSVHREEDVSEYNIIERDGLVNKYIASVPLRSSTSFTYNNTLANGQPVMLFVSAYDSCGNQGNFDERPTTMHLQTQYDHCAYQTSLSWNAYQAMKKGILEYRIYYSVNGGTFVRLGATQGTTYLHSGVDAGASVCYFIRVVNKDQSITASSNQVCFLADQANIPSFLYLKTATVKDVSAITVKLKVDNSVGFNAIDLFRSTDGINFSPAGSITGDGSADYEYTDNDVEPSQRSYFYRAAFRDSCGNSRAGSNTVQTILLQVKTESENIFVNHLQWSPYAGFAGNVAGYNIFRLVNDDPGAGPIAVTGPNGDSYIDNVEDAAPAGSKIDYMVQAVEGIGNPYDVMEKSNSNTVPVYIEGRLFIPNAFSPTGSNNTWKPVTHFVDKTDYKVRVFNRWGQLVFEAGDNEKAWDGAGWPAGVYVYLVNYKNARGEYLEQKGSITLLR